MTATIFDVTHTSLVDGPGVRTTVFFKGCNLACRWCHNPESQQAVPQLLFDRRKCGGCGSCAGICPTPDACTGCGKCAAACPTGARTRCGRDWTVDELVEEAARDIPFYEATGGGVTCSGGECMLQLKFLRDFLAACRARGIHTAVDTAGCVPWTSFEAVLPHTDLFLYDVKCADDALHRAGTGVSNARILDNLRRLAGTGAGVIVRVPVIPGFNDDPAEQAAIAALLEPLDLLAVELLPYHRMGDHKYAALGLAVPDYAVPIDADLAVLRELYPSRLLK